MANTELVEFPNKLHIFQEVTDIEEFLEKGRMEFDVRYGKKFVYKTSLHDFKLLNVLGSGSFGKAILSEHVATGEHYAIKLLEKSHIVKGKQIVHTLNEKKILESLNNPFTLYLECFFQDNSYLYFTMPLILGGEMFFHLRRFGRFDENLARFYAAQVLLGLEYIHYLDLVYRDLKPENLLIDTTGYVKISDFGFCKRVVGRAWTLCGTPEYLAPEIILSKGYSKSVDWWSYGVLLYEMCAGYPPFYAKDHLKLYEKIVQGKFKVASHFSGDLTNLLFNLLQIDLSKRFGNLKDGISEIKLHRWFNPVRWVDLMNFKVSAPFVPPVKGITDLSNFDYLDEDDLVIRISKVDTYAELFTEF